jgi:hypothetical protein
MDTASFDDDYQISRSEKWSLLSKNRGSDQGCRKCEHTSRDGVELLHLWASEA